MYEINVTGSKALLSSCLELEIPKVVYTSSVAALDLPAAGQVSDESSRAEVDRVVGHYKKSKFLAQEAVLELAESGLPVVLVNPSTPIGPGDLKPTATGKIIVDFLCRKMPAYLDTGLNLVPVEDVARSVSDGGVLLSTLYMVAKGIDTPYIRVVPKRSEKCLTRLA